MKTAQILHSEIKVLKKELKLKEAILEKNAVYIKNLEATLIDFKKNRFGPKSEKTNKDQLPLFNEIELIDDTKKTPKPQNGKKKTGKRTNLPEGLERINKTHDIDENQKQCPHDGNTLKHIGEVVTEKFHLTPAVVKVIKHIQYKDACSCGKHIVLAKKPKDIIPKSIATPELLSYICVSKYADTVRFRFLIAEEISSGSEPGSMTRVRSGSVQTRKQFASKVPTDSCSMFISEERLHVSVRAFKMED